MNYLRVFLCFLPVDMGRKKPWWSLMNKPTFSRVSESKAKGSGIDIWCFLVLSWCSNIARFIGFSIKCTILAKLYRKMTWFESTQIHNQARIYKTVGYIAGVFYVSDVNFCFLCTNFLHANQRTIRNIICM